MDGRTDGQAWRSRGSLTEILRTRLKFARSCVYSVLRRRSNRTNIRSSRAVTLLKLLLQKVFFPSVFILEVWMKQVLLPFVVIFLFGFTY